MADEKQYISRIKLADGTTATIKDQEARTVLENLFIDTIIFDCGSAEDDTTVTIMSDNK